jgi:hypothetical protein
MHATTEQVQAAAQRAKARGVRIVCEPISGEWFATSGSDPGRLYRVTAVSCTCPAFLERQHCQHNALLLVERGWDGDDPDPDPATPAAALVPATVPCSVCTGSGVEAVIIQWLPVRQPCPTCAGTGTLIPLPDAFSSPDGATAQAAA